MPVFECVIRLDPEHIGSLEDMIRQRGYAVKRIIKRAGPGGGTPGPTIYVLTVRVPAGGSHRTNLFDAFKRIGAEKHMRTWGTMILERRREKAWNYARAVLADVLAIYVSSLGLVTALTLQITGYLAERGGDLLDMFFGIMADSWAVIMAEASVPSIAYLLADYARHRRKYR